MRTQDDLTRRHSGLLDGSYDCVDRLVLNGYLSMCHSPGGFRVWWRRWHGGDDDLDNTHLLRLAGRFARRVRAFANAQGIPLIDCERGERKHLIAEEYLATHQVGRGVFMILVARAVSPTWKVTRSKSGVLVNLEKRPAFVNHYSFHIMDPDWGHVVIKISGHPPFGTQIILNGHNYVARRAGARAGVGYRKEGNCFTIVDDPARLAQLAQSLSRPAAIGRLRQVCDRWIYTSVLCFALDLAEQEAAGARYDYSVYQVEYSRNLLFADGAVMDQVFDRVVDRTRARLDVPRLKTLFGAKNRPHRDRKKPAVLAAVVETQSYDLTWFKVTFGCLGLKAYTKGERVLRIEATCHNTAELGCGRILERLPQIIGRLRACATRFSNTLDATSVGFLSQATLDQLPRSAQLGRTRVGGISLDSPRMRAVLAAVAALSPAPKGFTVADLAANVHATTGQTHTDYSLRQAAYDLRKLRAHNLVIKPGRSRRYHTPTDAVRTIVAITTLRDHVLEPLLAGVRSQQPRPNPTTWTAVEHDYETLRLDMRTLLTDLGIAA